MSGINAWNTFRRALPYFGTGMAIWVLDALVDAYLFHKGSFLETAIHELEGTEIYFRTVVIGMAVVSLFVYRQITQKRHAAEQARAHSEKVFHSITSAAHDAIVAFDPAHRITFWNQSAQRIFGYAPEEARNQDGRMLLAPHTDRSLLATLFPSDESIRQAAPAGHVIELTGQYKDGSAFPAEISTASLLLETDWNTVWIVRDITNRKQAEEALYRAYDEMETMVRVRTAELTSANDALRTKITEHERAEEKLHQAATVLQQQAAQLAEADRRKNEFLAMLAHELRNPLAPIQNAVHVLTLQPGTHNATFAWATEVIARQVEQLTHLVNDLLDTARITHGRIQLCKEPAELGKVLVQAMETARPLLEAHQHQLHFALPHLPVWLEADPARLAQIAGNLLNNAAKYTPKGGQIWLSAEREGQEAVVRVRDNGVGIAPAMLPKVFDLFVQENQALDRSSGGLGLGLSLVRSLAELHGGTVHAYSAGLGEGSEFVVRLPALDVEPMTPPSDAVTPNVVEGALRVLIVDDNEDVAKSLAMLLGVLGHEVQAVFDGPAALEAARAAPLDVAFLDIGLPGMNGFEVAERLQREHPGLLVVALTGYGQEDIRRRAQEAGFAYHLLKPAKPEELERLLAVIAASRPEGVSYAP